MTAEATTSVDGQRALVATLLSAARSLPWRRAEIGVLGLWLDPERRHRLHLWDGSDGEVVPIHDHPFAFSSTVIAGVVVDEVAEVAPEGQVFERFRYEPGDEAGRVADDVRLATTARTVVAGAAYHHGADELHTTRPAPGTVTLLECRWVPPRTMTVCLAPGQAWVPGAARPATPAEVDRAVELARTWLDQPVPPEATGLR